MKPLPPLSPPPAIHERLGLIFPEGTANRSYVTREIAAKTVFAMLYAGAVEGNDTWLRPDQVTRMTDAQAASIADAARETWARRSTYAPLLVFVEVVATDGPVNEARRTALMSMAADAGFHEEQVAFVTAYDDRDAGAFRRSVGKLAWRRSSGSCRNRTMSWHCIVDPGQGRFCCRN